MFRKYPDSQIIVSAPEITEYNLLFSEQQNDVLWEFRLLIENSSVHSCLTKFNRKISKEKMRPYVPTTFVILSIALSLISDASRYRSSSSRVLKW